MTEENTNQENEALVLDLEDIINSARILKLKTADGVKELKIYNLTTLTSLEAESKARDNLVLLKRADSIREELKEAKGKSKKELLEKQAENLKVKVIKHDYGADPAAVAFDAVKHAKAKGIPAVLIDTAEECILKQT